MWFNILKEDDADRVWTDKIRHYFIQALEEIFDEVEPETRRRDERVMIKQRYDDTYLTATIYISGPLYSNKINFIWADAEPKIIGNINLGVSSRGFKSGPFKNRQELLDNLKALDRKLMLYLTKPDMGWKVGQPTNTYPRMGAIIDDVMGWK